MRRKPGEWIDRGPRSEQVWPETLRELIDIETKRLSDPDSDLSSHGRAQAIQSITRLRTQLEKAEGRDAHMTDAKIIALPGFRRLVARIFTALEPWPEAYQAVVMSLREAGDGR